MNANEVNKMEATSRKQIAITLEKQGKRAKQKIWIDIAKRIVKPKRILPKVNIWKLNRFAQKLKGKTFVVPGHVLGTGEITNEIKVAALSFSETALLKIKNAKGKTYSLQGLAKEGEKTSSLVIIK